MKDAAQFVFEPWLDARDWDRYLPGRESESEMTDKIKYVAMVTRHTDILVLREDATEWAFALFVAGGLWFLAWVGWQAIGWAVRVGMIGG
jgi:hypothetical protein